VIVYNIRVFIRYERGEYEAECMEPYVVVRGLSLDETVAKLKAEVISRMEGADLSRLGYRVSDPTLFITLEDEPLLPPHGAA